MSEFSEVWDSKMRVVKMDDLKSKLAAISVIEKLIKLDEPQSIEDINLVINSYKEVLTGQLKGIHHEE